MVVVVMVAVVVEKVQANYAPSFNQAFTLKKFHLSLTPFHKPDSSYRILKSST
jgi:hypothetical protein